MGLHLPQEENKNNKMVLRKIPLEGMIELLQHLNQRGAEFIDIIGVSNDEGIQDELVIAVRDEYLKNEDEDNNYINEGLEENVQNPITIDYLNNLLGNGN